MTDIAADPREPSGTTPGRPLPSRSRWRPGPRRPVAAAGAQPTFLVGAAVVVFWIVCAIFGHAIAPYNPLAQQLLAVNAAPSGAHWFGTDPLGRDVLSRVIVGARSILTSPRWRPSWAPSSAPPSGWPWATSAGPSTCSPHGSWRPCWPCRVHHRLHVPGRARPDHHQLVIIIGFVFTPLIARTVRAAVLAERHLDYLSAARLLGENPTRIMFGEILPNVMPAILVEFTVRLGYAVFTVATLSFLASACSRPPRTGARTSRPTTST